MIAEETICTCGSIGEDPETVRICTLCHVYWRGDKRLTAVNRILRACWPIKPDYSAAPVDVVENARDRGVAVDMLFTRYLKGELQAIPAGTRSDAVELFFRLKKWTDAREFKSVQAQVILADQDVAGTCDVIADGWIYDLKTTYDIEPMYPLQVAAYAALYFEQFKTQVKGIGIIHVTKRYAQPKLIKIDIMDALIDWFLIRDTWRMATKRTGKTID